MEKDIPALSHAWREKTKKAIEEKIAYDPQAFGKPLRHTLKNLRSLRVGDYRVIFLIEKSTVLIVIIQHRSIAYKEAVKRLT